MKLLVFLLSVVVGCSSFAQTVVRVTGKDVLVRTNAGEKLVIGDEVNFLGKDLSAVGVGEVTKVSKEGSQVLVKITSGKAAAGMTYEKTAKKAETLQTQAVPVSTTSTEKLTYRDLSDEDRRILDRGEISDTAHVVGGILGTYPGFGLGHIVQGRYSEKGWIFTVGELGSAVLIVAGMGDCWDSSTQSYHTCNGGLIFAGAVAYIGLHIWEIVDIWAVPGEQNRRYRALKNRVDGQTQWVPMFTPLADGGTIGLQFRF